MKTDTHSQILPPLINFPKNAKPIFHERPRIDSFPLTEGPMKRVAHLFPSHTTVYLLCGEIRHIAAAEEMGGDEENREKPTKGTLEKSGPKSVPKLLETISLPGFWAFPVVNKDECWAS